MRLKDLRAVAVSEGRRIYGEAVPCRRGHTAGRYTSNKQCVECAKVYAEQNADRIKERMARYAPAYYAKNKERYSTIGKANYAKNRDRKLAANRAWRESNIERHREMIRRNYHENHQARIAKSKRWYRENKERAKAKTHKRRAVLKAVGGEHSAADLRAMFAFQRGRCAVCRTRIDSYHVDHIVPLSAGGSNGKDNLQLLCGPCNLSKGTKDPIEFMQRRGFLL